MSLGGSERSTTKTKVDLLINLRDKRDFLAEGGTGVQEEEGGRQRVDTNSGNRAVRE